MNYESANRPTQQRYSPELQRLISEMEQLKRDIYGDARYGTEGLLPTQKRIANKVEVLFRFLIGVLITEVVILSILIVVLAQQWL